MSAISELVFEDKLIVSYVSLAREQHIKNKEKLNKNEIIYGIDKINAENLIIDIKRDEEEENEIEDVNSSLFSINSKEISNDCLINGIINNSLSKPDITINTILPLYPIQCKELKYIKPSYKFKSVEIIAGSKANLLAHNASNKAATVIEEEKEVKKKDLQPIKPSKSSYLPKQSNKNNSNKSKQTKHNNNNSLTKMDSFFNKSDKSIEIKPLYYDEEDDIGSDVELPMMKKNKKSNINNNGDNDDESDESEYEGNDIVESDNDEVSDIIDDRKEKDNLKDDDNEKKKEENNEMISDEFEYNNSVDSEYEEKEENKNPTKGVYKLVSYIDENGFEVTEEKYVEEEVDITEEEKEKEKEIKKKDDLKNNNPPENIKVGKTKETNSKSKSKRNSKSDENEKDLPPKKKSKKSSNGQITISSFFKPK